MNLNRLFTRLGSQALLVLWIGASGGLFAAELQTEILQAILESETDGTAGVYVKEVDGPVVVNVNKTVVFEPASTLKALHLVHAMRAVQDGKLALSSMIPWCSDSFYFDKPRNGCPKPPCGEFIGLESALDKMMVLSDNRTTDAVASLFGVPALIETAEELGMTDTALNHSIGCGGPIPNTLTLQDIGSLYEEVAMGYLDASHRATMFDLMASPDHLGPTIDEEAAALGVDAAAVAQFKNDLGYFYKGGSYDMFGVFGAKYHRTFGGYVSLPTADGGADEYVFGAFVNHANTISSAENRIASLRPEILRQQIRAALSTFLPAPTVPAVNRLVVGLERRAERPGLQAAGRIWEAQRPWSQAETVQRSRATSKKPARSGSSGRKRKTRAPSTQLRTIEFIRADVNADGRIDALDAQSLLSYLFGDGGRPTCLDAADVNDDGEVNLADSTLLLAYLSGGAGLPRGTTPGEYQTDPTPDRIGCASSPAE